MGAIYLGSLPQVLRDAGLDVDTYPGWETTWRSSGGYDALLGIQIHHTASFTSPANDMAFMWRNASARPIGAIYLARTGKVTVGASGATNTSGRGGPLTTSRGVIPRDAANRYVISVEAANNGTGEPWPAVMVDAYIRLVAALNRAYFDGVLSTPGDVHGHFEWAPGRKFDPAGESPYAAGRALWNMNSFRRDVQGGSHVIYAGVDSNGTNHNRHDWVVPGGGSGLVLLEDWSVRTASLRNGVVTVGAHNGYSRPHTAQAFRVPFEVSGEIFLHSRLDDVFIFGENRHPTWEWGVNFHPVFVDEDNNVVTGFAPSRTHWSASGQINKTYGIPREEVFRANVDHSAMMGAWHRWRMVVPAVGVHEVYWDDRLVYRAVEKTPPAAWWSRPLHAGLRLDFYDYSLKLNSTGQKPTGQSKEKEMILDLHEGTPRWTALQLSGNELSHLVNGHHVAVLVRGGTPRVSLGVPGASGEVELEGVLLSTVTTNDSPFAPTRSDGSPNPASDQRLHNLWNSRKASK